MADISVLKLPNGNSVNLKDTVARSAISQLNSFDYVVCNVASNTPNGIGFQKTGEEPISGTLMPSVNTKHVIYLVPSLNGTGDLYDEYLTVETDTNVFVWEKIGDTSVDLSNYLTASQISNTYAPKSSPVFSNSITVGSSTITEAQFADLLELATIPDAEGESF